MKKKPEKAQLEQFKHLILRLFQCCQERMLYQSEKFGLPEAELRCLLLFDQERYLTPKGIALKMNVVKSRVTKIVDGLVKKGLVQKVKDPKDSRITLLALTSQGQTKLEKINAFINEIHLEILSGLVPGQRRTLLKNLQLLLANMEAAKDLMV